MRMMIGSDEAIRHTLTILDDVIVQPVEVQNLLGAFTVPTELITTVPLAAELWGMVKNTVRLDGKVLVLYPGNGGWLVRRLLREYASQDPKPFAGVDISRVSASAIEVPDGTSHIVVMEDVIEFGSTAARIREQLNGVTCGVTIASMIWHDRDGATDMTADRLSVYDNVLVSQRIRSDDPGDDVRSLSTLSRKAQLSKNQRYSAGREQQFLTEMRGVLQRHPWLNELGRTLGYRSDPA